MQACWNSVSRKIGWAYCELRANFRVGGYGHRGCRGYGYRFDYRYRAAALRSCRR